jgi:hypothetical protein
MSKPRIMSTVCRGHHNVHSQLSTFHQLGYFFTAGGAVVKWADGKERHYDPQIPDLS